MMAYCTNCGKEMLAKKCCEHCGVKKNKIHNFCEWCGTALYVNANVCTYCGEPKKAGTVAGKVISTFFAVVFLILALGSFKETPVAGICFLLFAFLLLPFTKNLIRKATHTNLKLRKIIKPVRIIALVVLFFVGGAALPESDTDYVGQFKDSLTSTSNNSNKEEEKEELTDQKIEALVVDALISEIKSDFKKADPESCRYKINKTEKKTGVGAGHDYLYVYGTVTLYDKHGELTDGKGYGSADWTRSFTVKIDYETGRVTSCTID